MNGLRDIAIRETVAKARTDFEQRGFEVVVAPKAKDLPSFLEGFVPDMIARKGAEAIVVGVKGAPPSDDDNRRAAYFASEVPKHPGWRFNLYVAEPRQELIDELLQPNKSELSIELQKAEAILRSQGPKPTLAYAWGLLESAVRSVVLNKQKGDARRYKPASVVEALVHDGFIDDDRGKELSVIGAVRNQIVHGFTGAEISKEQVVAVLNTIRSLIAEMPDNDGR